MPREPHFRPELFRFLRDLDQNNRREWFQANKERFEREVRRPLRQFVTDFGPKLGKISARFVADPKPVGGSIFRIHRDTRFSRDKRPYKTWAAMHFRHAEGKDIHAAPGFYLHLAPGNVFVGAGIWHPDGDALRKIRGAIVERSDEWTRAVSGRSFRETYELAGESLQRAPRGFDQDHPLIADIRRKDFVAVATVSEEEVLSPDFLSRYARVARVATPFMRFLTRAVEMAW